MHNDRFKVFMALLIAVLFSGCGPSEVAVMDEDWSAAETIASPENNIFDTAELRRSSSVIVTPDLLNMPVTSANPISICISGIRSGAFFTVSIPWVGSPAMHSAITYSNVRGDSSDPFCFDAPPSWAELKLDTGTYNVNLHLNGKRVAAQGPFTVQ